MKMNSMPLAFLNKLSFGVLDSDTSQCSWIDEETPLIEELKKRIEVNGGFDYFYINNILFIEMSKDRFAFFSFEDHESFLLVKSLTIKDFNYAKKNIEVIRKMIDE